MGWNCSNKPHQQSIKEFFNKTFGKEIVECLVVGYRTAYLAVRENDGQVRAVVCLLDNRSDLNFCYKALPEVAGPSYHHAPACVLNALTPLIDDGSQNYQTAQQWRNKCQANLERIDKIGTPLC